MRILFDHGTPRGLAGELPGHEVTRAKALGWEQLTNGELLNAAEGAGFQILLTTDGNIRYRQNLAARTIALVVLTGSTKWSRIRLHYREIASAVNRANRGSYEEVWIPFDERSDAS